MAGEVAGAGRSSLEALPIDGPRSLRISGLWLVGLVCLIGFPTLGWTFGLEGSAVLAYAIVVDAWWVVALVAMEVVGRRAQGAERRWSARATVALQATCVVVSWALLLPVAAGAGIGDPWLLTAAWLPGSILIVVGVGILQLDRARFGEERSRAEAELSALAAQEAALVEAHARIVEEARSASTSVSAAVRAAIRMAHDDAASSGMLRELLDTGLRAQARDASHRIHRLQAHAPEVPGPGARHRVGEWLDHLAMAPSWRLPWGFALVAVASLPATMATTPFPRGAIVEIGADLAGLAIAGALAAVARPRFATWRPWARRLALVGAFWAGMVVGMFLVQVGTGIPVTQAVGTVLLAAPAGTLVAMLPLVLTAGSRRRDIARAGLRADIALATARRDAALEQLESARQSVIRTLHSHVQGRAAAAVTAIDLARSGVPGTSAVVEAVLAELADLRIDLRPEDPAAAADPIASVLRSWSGVLDVVVEVDEVDGWAQRFRLAEVLQDLLLNAVIHGRARHAVVRIERPATCVVVDDGLGPRRGFRAGLGLGRVAEQGGSWTLERVGGRTRAVASLPAPATSRSAV